LPAADLAPGDAAGGAEPAPAAAPEAGLDHDLKVRERELIMTTLRETGGSRKLTAQRLGVSPRTLRYKLQQLKAAGLSVPHGQALALEP
jgi:two-component system response regulator FlrC